jgi:hypothetical protein
MPTYKFTDQDNQTFELLPAGDYPFEVTGVDFGIQSGGKTNGSDYMELKVTLYKDATFAQKLSLIRDRIIFHPACAWRADCFVKSAALTVDGQPPAKGQEIEFNDEAVVGLRGWCSVKVESYKNKSGEDAKANRVAVWLTNKPKLPRAVEVATTEPTDDDNLPF